MKAELLEVFGNDTMVCQAARVSYSKEASNYTDEQNVKLIKYLAKHNHWSCFAHPKLQFRLTMPIFVERQIIKTQAGVEYNSISGRYVDFSDTYTRIGEWRNQSTDSKQGSDGPLSDKIQGACGDVQDKVIKTCKEAYNRLISLGVSKEQARTVLPLNLNTTQIWTGSLYSFIRLCKQRLKPDAQAETRQLVQMMLDQVKENGSFKDSLKAYEL